MAEEEITPVVETVVVNHCCDCNSDDNGSGLVSQRLDAALAYATACENHVIDEETRAAANRLLRHHFSDGIPSPVKMPAWDVGGK